MQTYNITWTEKMSINVQANSKEEAEEKIKNCEYNNAEVSSEIVEILENREIE